MAKGEVVFTETDVPPPPGEDLVLNWVSRPSGSDGTANIWCTWIKRAPANDDGKVSVAEANLHLFRFLSEADAKNAFQELNPAWGYTNLTYEENTPDRISAYADSPLNFSMFRIIRYGNFVILLDAHSETRTRSSDVSSYIDTMEDAAKALAQKKGFIGPPPVYADSTSGAKTGNGIFNPGGGDIPAGTAAAAGAVGAGVILATTLLLNVGTTAAGAGEAVSMAASHGTGDIYKEILDKSKYNLELKQDTSLHRWSPHEVKEPGAGPFPEQQAQEITNILESEGEPDLSDVYRDRELILPRDSGFEEISPPEELLSDLLSDTQKFQDTEISGTQGNPPDLNIPADIFEIPPPEDPDDGVMTAGGDEHAAWKMLLNWIQRGREMKVESPQNLPEYMKSQQDGETVWQMIKRKLWDDTPGRYNTSDQRMKNLEGIHEGLDIVRNSGVLDSKSPLIKAISDPVRFSQTGEGDPKVFIKLLIGELASEEASEDIRAIRRALPLFDPLTNTKTITPGPGGPTELPGQPKVQLPADLGKYLRGQGLKDTLGSKEVIRNWSGPPQAGLDVITKDPKDFMGASGTGIIQPDKEGIQALKQFRTRYGALPDVNDTQQVEIFMQMFRRLKGQ